MLAYIGKYPHTISVLQNSSIYRVFYMSQKGTFSSPEKRQERNEYVIGHVTCNSCLVFWFCAHGHAYYCFTLFLFIKKPLLLVKLWNHNGYCGKVKRLIHFYCCVSPKILLRDRFTSTVHHMGGREAQAVMYQPQSREFRILWPMLTGQRQDFLSTKDSTHVNWITSVKKQNKSNSSIIWLHKFQLFNTH